VRKQVDAGLGKKRASGIELVVLKATNRCLDACQGRQFARSRFLTASFRSPRYRTSTDSQKAKIFNIRRRKFLITHEIFLVPYRFLRRKSPARRVLKRKGRGGILRDFHKTDDLLDDARDQEISEGKCN
jgi:hypothetical protein